jgi:hypothetical protein
MKIEIIPLEKVVIDGKSICLGMRKPEVIKLLGEGEFLHRHYFYDNELAIDYDANENVEFIEFLGGIDGKLHPNIYGISAFDSMYDEVTDILEKHNNGDIDDSEKGYSYAYLNISVGIYRETIPENVQKDIECMKQEGVYDPEYVEEQMRKANHWATIGIGKKGYYSRS